MPDSIVEAVTFHHTPGLRPAAKPGLLTSLHVANGLINMCQMEKESLNYAPYLDMPYLQRLDLTGRLDEWVSVARDLLKTVY